MLKEVWNVERPSVAQSLAKLAIAGEQAGIGFHLIHMLSTGITVETLLNLIESRPHKPDPTADRSSRWVM
jgi:hypothetical protein